MSDVNPDPLEKITEFTSEDSDEDKSSEDVIIDEDEENE